MNDMHSELYALMNDMHTELYTLMNDMHTELYLLLDSGGRRPQWVGAAATAGPVWPELLPLLHPLH